MTVHPWTHKYPSGVSPEIEPISQRNLPELLREAAHRYANAIAFTQCMPNGMNGSLRYRDVDTYSDAFAVYLREVTGLGAGDRVAIQMPNCLAYPVAAFGILKAGCVLVNTNPLYTAPEMVHQFSDSGVKALIITDMFADRLPAVLSKTGIEIVVTARIAEFFPPVIARIIRMVQKYWDRSLHPITEKHTAFKEALEAGRQQLARGVKPEAYLTGMGPNTLAALQYTGGTTGVAKGAMLSHANMLANVYQTSELMGSNLRPGAETILTALPLYHIFAFTVNLLLFYSQGARNILVPSPRPPSNLKRTFENYRITWLTGVNTLFNALLNERWFVAHPPPHLQASIAGGMSLLPTVAEQWRKITKTPVVEGFGLSEASPVIACNPLGGVIKDGSIGIPLPSTEIRCVDDNGKATPVGEPGEMLVRGPQVMQGYWQSPAETEKVLVDGWLHTGDIARMDEDGYFFIADRKKDMVLVSGFNVFPNEVEAVIAAHPEVSEAAVVGIPDAKSGEAVKAFVVAKAPGLTEESLIKHCRDSLASYKVPRSVEFRDELPKNLIGKILRKDLRDKPAPENAGSSQGESETGRG